MATTSEAQVAIPNIEADENDDTDSAFNGSTASASYATTLASSVKNYVYAPNDEIEQDRMDLTHHIYKLLLGGDIYVSPIKANAQRILDIGTGTGIWAIDFADAHPESEVIGNDLSPIQPSWVPSNCSFEIDDLEATWPYSRPFDFIHGRELAGSISDFDKLFAQAYKHLTPGGFFEIQSIEPAFYSDDGTLSKAKNAVRWGDLVLESSAKFGKPLNVVPSLPDKLKRVGFQDVSTIVLKLPIGSWAKDKKFKELGRFQQLQVLEALEPYSLFLFTKILGWTIAETQVLIAGVRADIKNREIHMYNWVHFTYGRKPLDAPGGA
ncbi:hypothetical protein GX48_00380 [Paracoccidioides brasiliensis]|nr:hypothetical protein GX48_00380 [Paracoccidioides brasiliensis]